MPSNFDDFSEENSAAIDLTPLIDVIFMLLVFFIVATTFAKPNFEVNLPISGTTVAAEDEKNFVSVTISENGKIFFDGEEIEPERVPEAFQNLGHDQILKVFADENAPFKSVFLLMDEAKKNKHEKIFFMVEKRRD